MQDALPYLTEISLTFLVGSTVGLLHRRSISQFRIFIVVAFLAIISAFIHELIFPGFSFAPLMLLGLIIVGYSTGRLAVYFTFKR